MESRRFDYSVLLQVTQSITLSLLPEVDRSPAAWLSSAKRHSRARRLAIACFWAARCQLFSFMLYTENMVKTMYVPEAVLTVETACWIWNR